MSLQALTSAMQYFSDGINQENCRLTSAFKKDVANAIRTIGPSDLKPLKQALCGWRQTVDPIFFIRMPGCDLHGQPLSHDEETFLADGFKQIITALYELNDLGLTYLETHYNLEYGRTFQQFMKGIALKNKTEKLFEYYVDPRKCVLEDRYSGALCIDETELKAGLTRFLLDYCKANLLSFTPVEI